MSRVIAFAYGIFSYLIFLGTFLYAIGFVGGFVVPKSVDSGAATSFWSAVTIDVGLLAVFGLQHSVMARPAFKKWWTRIVPKPVERSTYVLFASLALILLFRLWQPLPGTVWTVEGDVGRTLLWGLFGLGWALVLGATFMISHAHLFGLAQVAEHLRGQDVSPPQFQTPGLYRHVRHPIMLGFLIAFWATPTMSTGHLLFAVVTTGYILVALQFEERDLANAFGERYERYRERVPRFIPRFSRTAGRAEPGTGDGP